jgi:hypothetical protein
MILNLPLINVVPCGQLAVGSLNCLEKFNTMRDFAFGKYLAIACSSGLPLFLNKTLFAKGNYKIKFI